MLGIFRWLYTLQMGGTSNEENTNRVVACSTRRGKAGGIV